MVTATDFIDYLQSVGAFEQAAKNVRNTALSTKESEDDTEMLKKTFELISTAFPECRAVRCMFAWRDTPEGEKYWITIHRGWEQKCQSLQKNTQVSLDLILNYFEGKGLLQEVQAIQKRTTEEHKRMGDLPQDTTLEDIYRNLLDVLNMPELFLEGTFYFGGEKDPEKWFKVNAEYKDWLASLNTVRN